MQDFFGGHSHDAPDNGPFVVDPPKTGRKPRATGKTTVPKATKEDLKRSFEIANMGLQFTPYGDYRLTEEEIDSLSCAYFEVLKEYPAIMRYLTMGRKGSAVTNALIVTYMVAAPRIDRFNATQSAKRAAHHDDRHNGVGQDIPATTVNFN